MTFEVDSKISEDLIEEIKKVDGIKKVILINKIEDGE